MEQSKAKHGSKAEAKPLNLYSTLARLRASHAH